MPLNAGEQYSGGEVRDASGRLVVVADSGGGGGTMNYAKLTAGGTWTVPAAITVVRYRLTGTGGVGGAGGSAAAQQLQVGGGGGGAGVVVEQEVTVNPGDVLTYVQAAPASAPAGGTAGGNAGSAGGNAGNGTLTNTTQAVLLAQAPAGVKGLPSTASSTTAAACGIYGTAAQTTNSSISLGPGSGSLAGNAVGPFICVLGGAAGGTATASNGGGAGGAATPATGLLPPTQGSQSGTVAGVNGVTATIPGCGGGGGGGGANVTGAGGNGGQGAAGQCEFFW